MIIKELPWREPNRTITLEGREFSRGGVRIDEFELYAYVGAQIDPRPGEPPLHVLTNWHGERIGTIRLTSSWPIPRSVYSPRMFQAYATVKGRTYTGRTGGEGLSFRGRRIASERS